MKDIKISEQELAKYVALRHLKDDGFSDKVEIIPKDKLPPDARKTGRKFGVTFPVSEYIVGSQKAVDAYYGIAEKVKKMEQIKKNGRTDFIPWQPRRGG